VHKKNKEVKSLIKNLCFSHPQRITADLLNASSHETYVETVSSSADTVHYQLNEWDCCSLQTTYSRICEDKIRKLHLGICDVYVDITEEDFYGEVDSLWLHPWTGEKGVKAHFKFIVCSVRYRNRKFPIAIVMLSLGAIIADSLALLLESCKRAGISIRTVMLDRGFYSADVLRELKEQKVIYLVFAKRCALFNNMLASTKKSVIVEHELVLNKNKTKQKIQTNIVLVKNILGYDWTFATNLDIPGCRIVRRYRMRWNIETDFRVQDEARIKSKSKRPEVRLFYFMMSCLLLFTWNATQKFEMPFKRFVIESAKQHEIDFNQGLQ